MRKARVCPNSNLWNSPSGGWKGSPNTFPGNSGFGFDEWLTAHSMRSPLPWMKPNTDYYIAFIQAYKKQRPGFRDDLELFTINPNGTRLLVGTIKDCVRLSHSEAASLHTALVHSGAITLMQGFVNRYCPRHQPLHLMPPEEMINACFESTMINFQQPPIPTHHNHSRYSILYR